MPFKPGQSGNPKGRRPVGGYLSEVLDRTQEETGIDHKSEILHKILEKAKEGDSTCLQICADRLYPKLKPKPSPSPIPQLDPNGSVTDAARSILGALASGQLDTEQSANVMRALSDYARIEEFDELKREILELKEMYLRDKR